MKEILKIIQDNKPMHREELVKRVADETKQGHVAIESQIARLARSGKIIYVGWRNPVIEIVKGK